MSGRTIKEKEVDVLDQDLPINGQKFVCVSFLSPDKLLRQKEQYFMNAFLKQVDTKKSFERYQAFLRFLSYKYNLSFDDVLKDVNEFVEAEKDTFCNENFYDEYQTFIEKREEELTREFSKQHDFQTNVRGLKIRGSYETQEEAEMRCKHLRKNDPNHDIYVGPVGVWMPWEPDAYKTGKVEYLEKDLNQLMKEKIHNTEVQKKEFDERVKQSKINAIEENKKKAKESGVKLSQNVKKDGTLYKTNKVPGPSGPVRTEKGVYTEEGKFIDNSMLNNIERNVENKMKNIKEE